MFRAEIDLELMYPTLEGAEAVAETFAHELNMHPYVRATVASIVEVNRKEKDE